MSIAGNLAIVKRNIQLAQEKRKTLTGIDEPVNLIAVTKNHGIDEMEEAITAGATVVGENRVQEALAKYDHFQRQLEYHLLGHLQTNKVKQAVFLFDLIHSVDSLKLAEHISRAAVKIEKVQPILLEVNVAQEASKFGMKLDEVIPFLNEAADLPGISIQGLMTVAPHFEDPEATRPFFHSLYEKFLEVKALSWSNCMMKWLSMGMTNDYVVAVEEGANMVRVGTAIFGERDYAIELTRR